MHVLGPLRHVEDHVEGLVNTSDASRLLWFPTNRSQLLGHVRLVHVLTDLTSLDQVHDLFSYGLNLDVDLVVSIRRLAFDWTGFAPDCFSVDHDRLGSNNLQTGLRNQSVCNLKMEGSHSRDEIFARLLVDACDQIRIF